LISSIYHGIIVEILENVFEIFMALYTLLLHTYHVFSKRNKIWIGVCHVPQPKNLVSIHFKLIRVPLKLIFETIISLFIEFKYVGRISPV